MKVRASRIEAISYYLPQKTVSNEDLARDFASWSPDKIRGKTGIRERHVVAPGETVSDLAVAAAERLFAEHGVDRRAVDFVLLCTQTPDYFLPTTACLVQDRLGLRTSVGALDFNLGCSGYVYGLALAHGLVVSGVASNVLLITAETYTRHIHPQDRSTRTIFGDGAAATLVELTEVAGIGKFVFGTDGRGAENLIVPAGGSRKPRSAETSIVRTDKDGNQRSDENLFMNGMEVFNFTIASVPKLVQETLATNGMIEVDYYVFHQANKFMLDHLRQKCGISESKFYLDVEHTGNTVSATIPIALRMAQESGRLKTGMHVLIAGFGVGYSWGGTTLTW